MNESRNGGTVKAMHIPAQLDETTASSTAPWQATKAALRALCRLLLESARGEDFNRAFSGTPGAQFGALPKDQQNRLLNRGFRP
jgi:hypothetical protein